MAAKYETEQYAPIRFDELEPATRSLVRTVSDVVVNKVGMKIAKYQTRQPRFVPIHMRGSDVSRHGDNENELYLNLKANIINPRFPFAFDMFLTEIIRHGTQQLEDRATEHKALSQTETDKRYHVTFSDGKLFAPHNPDAILPGVEVKFITNIVNDITDNDGLSVDLISGSQKTFRVPRWLPKENSILRELGIFDTLGSGQSHQATFNNHFQNSKLISRV